MAFRKSWGYGRSHGRPEEVVFPSDKGIQILHDRELISGSSFSDQERSPKSFSLDHQLLLNWFRIHLIHMERMIPSLSVNFLTDGVYAGRLFTRSLQNPPLSRLQGEFIPDGIFGIKHRETGTALLFFLEVDMSTETMASRGKHTSSIHQKILRYQELFRNERYKCLEEVFESRLKGFRLLFLTNTEARLAALCRLIEHLDNVDFVWLADQARMFAHGLSANIWVRGCRFSDPRSSILRPDLAVDSPVIPTIR